MSLRASRRRPARPGCRQRPSAERFDRAAAMIADVADALHHAHQQGVTHRDVKPSNLLLSADGRLSVTDFGLARMLEQPGMTVTGEFVGTPAYMSPEQITAGRVPVDHRTDVYSLGATLYELLTLRPPFRADGRDKLLAHGHSEGAGRAAVGRSEDAARSGDDLSEMPGEGPRPPLPEREGSGRRPAPLRQPVRHPGAKRAGPLARASKWVKRNPWAAVLLGCLFIALIAAGLFALQAMRAGDLLRERDRQAVVDKAIVAAMSGDAETALQAVGDAEQAGAEPGRLNMLRGVIELHRGRVKEAIGHLERAEKQWPDSVAVKGLLATAYLADTHDMRYGETVAQAERLGPKTPDDFIFLGLAQAAVDVRKGLETLDRAPAPPAVRRSRGSRAPSSKPGTPRRRAGPRTPNEALKDIDRVELADNPLLMNMHVQAPSGGTCGRAGSGGAGRLLEAGRRRRRSASAVPRPAGRHPGALHLLRRHRRRRRLGGDGPSGQTACRQAGRVRGL